LRGIIEGAGGDFSATFWGKWKMVVQCFAVGFSLLGMALAPPSSLLLGLRHVAIWGSVLITIYSGLDYTLAAARVLRGEEK
jgi:CDP-diacylglycerol--glycerol-3-phosphate 3-phosphatidyltransferase